MKRYDIFLLDADNTLFDFNMAESNALEIVFQHYGFSYNNDICLKYREINNPLWEEFAKGNITKDEIQTLRFTTLFKEIGVKYNVKDFNNMYLIELGKGSFLIDGALEICKEISAYNKIYIVTNGIMITQKTRIEHSVLRHYISDFFVSETVGYQKPNPLYFDYVFLHIPQIEKDKIILVGDSITADIAGGNNAGIDTCWFNNTGNINNTEIIPTYEIKRLNELKKFINKEKKME